MKSSDLSIIAYGCVANVPREASVFESFKRYVYSARDRIEFRLGRLDALDFRNHEDSGTYNLGDHAIMLACLQAIHHVRPTAALLPVNWMQLSEHHADHDAMVICGSGYFFLDAHFQLPPRIASDIAFLEKYDIPAVLYGVGVNLTDATLKSRIFDLPPDQKFLLGRLLKRCSHISVRDEASRQLLQSCTDKPVMLVGDPALFSGRAMVDGQRPAERPNNIGVNLPFHGAAVNRQLVESFPSWIETFKQIQRLSGCHYMYMVHYDAELVVAKMMRDAGIDLTIVHGDVNELLAGYSGLRLHLGGMLHSCILAASSGTPCIGLAYDIKHVGFFETLELQDMCFSTQPWPGELIVQKSIWALSAEPLLRSQILERRSFFEAKALAFLEKALSALDHES